jgi:hypothetical protein
MKRIFCGGVTPILISAFILTSACVSSQSFIPVKGNGPSVDKNISASGYNRIDVSGGLDVVLVQGNSEGVTLTAQENLFEYITVKVEQGVLKIYTEKNIQPIKPMKARISFTNLENLKVSGGGDVNSESPVHVPELDANVSGGGDFRMMINTEKLEFNISGGGDASIDGSIKDYDLQISGGGDVKSDVNANVIDCNVTGGGDITLTGKDKASDARVSISGGGNITLEMKADKLTCTVSGGGDANLSGQATNLDLNINGGGDVSAGRLLTDNTAFHVSGGSDIHVNASKELSGNISGGGDVYYSGSPAKVTIDAKGGSEIHKE